ncbi:unnamed protein product [Ilex paraguariensis]|uniref:Uncharacterized protein n=1 Tax=Ilex paraguariensis TaxID=185542 RepID=A0ABC8RRC6_9AQUA
MSSILTSQGAVLATAAVAVSGTVLLLAFRLQKSLPTTQFSINSIPQSPPSGPPRSCISSDGKRREKKKKRVHFAEDVLDPIGNSDEYRKLQSSNNSHRNTSVSKSSTTTFKNSEKVQRRMPANRLALYNGILRNRVLHRVAYSSY